MKIFVFIVLILEILIQSKAAGASNRLEVGCHHELFLDKKTIIYWSGVNGVVDPNNFSAKGNVNVTVEIKRLDGSIYTTAGKLDYIKIGNRLEVELGSQGILGIKPDDFVATFGKVPEFNCYIQ